MIDTVDAILRKVRSDKDSHKVERLAHDIRNEIAKEQRRTRPFIAWDGEGYNKDRNHYYGYFGNSIGDRIKADNLGWQECIELLLNSPKEANHVIYAGTYDIVMLFKDTPVAHKLLHGEQVRLNQYRIRFLKGKMLQVTDTKTRRSRTLYDVFTFFRVSFVKACREYGIGSPEVLANVERMKALRNDFTTVDDDTATYMGQELDLLVDLCEDLRHRLALANIHPTQWHGPGAIASAALKANRIKDALGTYTDDFRRDAEAAYYGGRFEQFQRGTHDGKVYQYDIRSAYPDAMQHLPNLANINWHHITNRNAEHDDYALYRVQVSHIPGDSLIGRLPHRNRTGTIYFPPWADGWYWGIECAHVPMKYRAEAWRPTGFGLHQRPFKFVVEAYRQRAILKKANQPQQLAIKLMLNSLYGKLAQSIGAVKGPHGWKYPTFHEIVYAGWITAYTRNKLANAMQSVDHTDIIACETDSVFSKVPLPMDAAPIGHDLGEWEYTISEGLRYIQSGVSMILDTEGVWHFKTRGFTLRPEQVEMAVWEKFLASDNPTMKITQTRFGTDPRLDTFGKWYRQERNLSLEGNPLEKRLHVKPCVECKKKHSLMDSMHPLVCSPIERRPSVAYKFLWRNDLPQTLGDMLLEEVDNDPLLFTELEAL